MTSEMTSLCCWNNYPHSKALVKRPESCRDLKLAEDGATLARGLGRSYGDAALNGGHSVLLMERLNRLLAFDEVSGLLRAEAGTTLADILNIFIPRGWFLPVTPGTKYVTLGGCFAADVHGKNHHVDGSFSRYVTEIELLTADGSRLRCSKNLNTPLFWASAGGMGLTGIITEITLQLVPIETSFVNVSHHAAANIDKLMDAFAEPALDDKYSVAWIDCLAKGRQMGRGILMTGHHATAAHLQSHKTQLLPAPAAAKRSIPCYLPDKALNYWSIKAFNSLYYHTQSRKHHFLSDIDNFFYPLDGINDWNRIYGRRGFLQYQCLIPPAAAKKALPQLLTKLSDSRRASFLAVLKRFGQQGEGLLSFPREGFTLALDIPLADPGVFALLDQLDDIVLAYGGRVYLAKDARLQPETFRRMYPRLAEWQKIKQTIDPHGRISSDLGRRLQMGKKL